MPVAQIELRPLVQRRASVTCHFQPMPNFFHEGMRLIETGQHTQTGHRKQQADQVLPSCLAVLGPGHGWQPLTGRIWAGAAPGHSCRAHPISTQDCQEAPGRCCATKGQSIRGSAAETALRNLWLLEYSQCLVELVRYHFKSLLTALIHLLSTRIPNELSALVRRPWRLHWQKPTPQLFFPNMCNMHCSALHCMAGAYRALSYQ